MRSMKWLLVVSGLLSTAAAAQTPAPPAPAPAPGAAPTVRQRAPRPTGPSLAGGRDEDFGEDAPPPAAAGLPAPDEPTLLRATLWAFEPAPREIRIQAIEDLGLLGDPRLLNPLAHMVLEQDQTVQLAAIRAVRAMRHPRSEEILVNVVRHPTLPQAVKQVALEGLLFQNTRSALVFLWGVGSNPQWGTVLYGAARRLLLEVPREAWGRPT